MTKEGMIKLTKARLEQKSQERHFSDETVLSMKRVYEIKCERYESKIKELEAQIEKNEKIHKGLLGRKKSKRLFKLHH